MNRLTQLIRDDMKPALGVTEPGAIAFAAAKARSYTNGPIESVSVAMNSGMYKNAFTCGIPNSNEVGNIFSAALGVVAGDCEKGLESLANVTPEDNVAAQKLVDEGRVHVKLSGITSDIFIEATVKTASDECIVTIRDAHTNIVRIVVNGKAVFEKEAEKAENLDGQPGGGHEIHSYTLAQLVEYAKTVPFSEIEFIREAYKVNLELFEEGLANPRTTFARYLKKMNGDEVFSKDALKTAQLLCNAAIEARVIGLDKPAMSITGSGAHGIIATMPLYAECKARDLPEEKLLRATALSYLVCMYIKEYSGRLSAFCGCAIAAGTGMACALVFLRDGTVEQMTHTINNMASSITGMICDGGNQGCTMKGIVAVDAAFKSVELAMNGTYIFDVHGINGRTPELTMKHMGLIASPGMVGTEKTIVEIFESKLK
ncbi:serine dehydratase subunit alpha family protein [Anaerotruncus rubiinfantis]|uniref:serine dehydratase subunit alpha family protein n=1 Tax=Anaerotruncus rubiinfantis TaxID=1720200 RepID=UPI0034A2926F